MGKWEYKALSGQVKLLFGDGLLILKILHEKRSKKDPFYPIAKEVVRHASNGAKFYLTQSHQNIELVATVTNVSSIEAILALVQKDLPEGFLLTFPQKGAKQ